MTPEARPELLRPEPIVHPRQQYLLGLLQRPSLPQGADELIREAIAEYDSAFGRPRAERTDRGKTINFTFSASLPDDGEENVILAGKTHTLTTRFRGGEEPAEPTDDLFTHLVVVVDLRNMPGVNLYPDWLRYVPVDATGNSRETRFLLEVPDNLRGYNGRIGLDVFNGGRLAIRNGTDLKLR